MEFEVLKFSGGLIKQFSPVYFTIEEDEFYYKKKKSDDNFQRYHISYITEVYIKQKLKEKIKSNIYKKLINKSMEKERKKKLLCFFRIYQKVYFLQRYYLYLIYYYFHFWKLYSFLLKVNSAYIFLFLFSY